MSHNVKITLLDNGNFNYEPGLLRVRPNEEVTFTCNVPFRIQFLHGTPFGDPDSRQAVAEIAGTGTQGPFRVTTAEKRAYRYYVAAVIGSAPPFVDASSPTIIVF